MSPERRKLDKKFFEEYGKLLKTLKLKTIYLKEANYRYLVPREEIPHKCELGITTSKESRFKDGCFEVDCQFSVTGKTGGQVNFQIDGTFCLRYDLSFEFSKGVIDYFCDNHFTTHVWPYIREFLQNTANRMELGPIVLPLSSRHLPKKKTKK